MQLSSIYSCDPQVYHLSTTIDSKRHCTVVAHQRFLFEVVHKLHNIGGWTANVSGFKTELRCHERSFITLVKVSQNRRS